MSNNATGGSGGAIRAADGDIILSPSRGDVLLVGNAAGLDGGALAAFTGNVSVGNPAGAVDIENNAAQGSGGAIQAAGAVTVSGAATISNNSAGAQGGAIWAGGSVTLNATSGDITFSGNSESHASTPQANAIYLDNTGGLATLTLNAGSGHTITFFDPIASNLADGPVSVVVSGAGTVEIDGSRYSNATDQTSQIDANTTLESGVFRVDRGAVYGTSNSRLTVLSGATLGGTGTVGGAVINGGVVRPGGSIGTLTVGSYTQGPGGTLAIEVSPAAASQLNSLGAASLDGRLALTFDPGTYGAHIYDILNGHPVTGTFSSVTAVGSPPPGIVAGLVYAPTQVELVAEATANAQIYGAVQGASLDRAQNFAGLVEDRFGDAACPDGSADKRAPACAGYGVWAYAIGSWNDHGANGALFGYRNDGVGVVAGIDRSWDNGSLVGGAFGYSHNDLTMNAAAAKASGPSYYGALYGRLVDGRTWFDGEVFYMHTGWTVDRALPGIGVATSSPNADSEGFLLQASMPIGDIGLRPYARFTYALSHRGAAFENGVGPLGYAIVSDQQSAAVGELGLLYEPTFTTGGGIVLRPALQVGIQDNAGDHGETVLGSLGRLTGTAFAQAAPQLWGVAGVVDGSIKVQVNKSFELFGDVRGRFGEHQTDGLAGIGGVFRF